MNGNIVGAEQTQIITMNQKTRRKETCWKNSSRKIHQQDASFFEEALNIAIEEKGKEKTDHSVIL